jgi:catechol-2,3-dioxygenase
MKAKIARVVKRVKDFEGLAAWYCEVFGLKLKSSRPDARWVEMDKG